MAFKDLWSTEVYRGGGSLRRLGIRVMVDVDDESLLEADGVRRAGMRATDEIKKALDLEAAKRDPETKTLRQAVKKGFMASFTEAGFSPIYMEAIANEYWGDDAVALSSPWYVVTTPVGHFKVGWRKRVIVLDWERTTIKVGASVLFKDENVTMGDRMIHCWGYKDLQKYLQTLQGARAEHDHDSSEEVRAAR